MSLKSTEVVVYRASSLHFRTTYVVSPCAGPVHVGAADFNARWGPSLPRPLTKGGSAPLEPTKYDLC